MEDLNHEQHQIHSMAEHEAEMQRQMMSVPPSGSIIAPPPGMLMPNIVKPPNMVPPPQMGISMMHSVNDINQPLPPFNPPTEPSNWDSDETDKSSHNLPALMSVKVDKPEDVKSNTQNVSEVILPKALEDVFAFKDQLADEMGRVDGEIPIEIEKIVPRSMTGVIITDYADADPESDDEEEMASVPVTKTKGQHRLDKNKKKKQRKKQNKKSRQNKTHQSEDKIINGNYTPASFTHLLSK